MTSSDSHSSVRRFAGSSSDPSREYQQWKRWAQAYCIVQKARGTPEAALGPLLYTLIDEPALKCLENIQIADLARDGGEVVLLERLEDRYPEPEATDKIGETLDRVFALRYQRNERTTEYIGRARVAFETADTEGIILPSVAKGYLLLRGTSLQADQRAIVMAAARRSYEEMDMTAALRATYPEVMPEQRRVPAHLVSDEVADYVDEPTDALVAEGEHDEPEIDTLISDLQEDAIEEEEAVEILVSWKEQRAAINREKGARGFHPLQKEGRDPRSPGFRSVCDASCVAKSDIARETARGDGRAQARAKRVGGRSSSPPRQ